MLARIIVVLTLGVATPAAAQVAVGGAAGHGAMSSSAEPAPGIWAISAGIAAVRARWRWR